MELRIPMQHPTVRPWPWPEWDAREDLLDRYQRRRLRLTLQDLAQLSIHDPRGLNIDWNHLPRQEIAVYVPKNLRNLIRLDTSNPARSTGLSYQAGSWPATTPPSSRSVKGFSLFGGDDWKLPDLKHLRLEPMPMSPVGVEGSYSRHWESARAWAGGALVLVAIVLFVRAIEKCLHRKLFKTRRRQSEEWPTPNVLATSHRHVNDFDLPSTQRIEDSDVFQSEGNQETISNDLPPPYSECANVEPDSDVNKYIGPEEPPPPYSACYVAYSNPKDGVPSVHFLNRQRENIFVNRLDAGHTSSMPDVNIQNADNTAKESDGCENSKTELVFENGRVVEKEENDVNNASNTQSNVNDECVVNISESGSAIVPDSSSLQV